MHAWDAINVNAKLTRKINPGERRNIHIRYTGILKGYTEEGIRYVKEHIDKEFTIVRFDGFGYPIIAYQDYDRLWSVTKFKHDYQISVTVPNDLIVANGGTLIGVQQHENTKTYTYKSKLPS